MDNKTLVVKHNSIIEARYKLSLMEQKIIIYLISLIKPEDKDFQLYHLPIRDFFQITGVSTNNYSVIEEITTKLMRRVLKIKEQDGTLTIYNWASRCKIIPGKGIMEFRFDPDLKGYFLELKKQFTQYQLRNILYLRSGYSIRIYELLKQYEKIGKRTFDLDELRLIVLGEDTNQYKRYVHFKQRILVPAQEELAKNTDIIFDFNLIKAGKKVTGIEFIIQRNRSTENGELGSPSPIEVEVPELKYTDEEADVLSALRAYAVGKAEEYVKTYPVEYLAEKIALAEKARKKKGTRSEPFNMGGFISQAIQNDWKDEAVQEKAEPRNRRKGISKVEKAKDRAKELLKQYEDEYLALRASFLSGLNDEEILAYKRQYWIENQFSPLIRDIIENPDDPSQKGNKTGQQLFETWLLQKTAMDINTRFEGWLTAHKYTFSREFGGKGEWLVFE